MILDALVRDCETMDLVDDGAHALAMAQVEAALARTQAALGIIPVEAGDAISAAALALVPEHEGLAASVRRSGTPVLGLVAQLREAVGPPHNGHIHWGVTSQDIVDSAMVLTSRAALEHLETKLAAVIARLIPLAESHRDTPMAGRTRFQQAVPVTFGLRVAGWIAPLLRHLDRLDELRARLLVVQLGGAAGTLSALAGKGSALTEALAGELGLGVPLAPWHSQRDTIAELGAWLALVAGAMAKLGTDTVLLSQTEIGELAEGGHGHGVSSTMPQKANPILGEALISIGRLAAGQLTGIYGALAHAGERDGAAWQMEWYALPELFALAGAALGNGEKLAAGLRINVARMDHNLKASGGLILAEAAAFTLATRMPLAEAQGIVAEAAKAAVENHEDLIETLAARLDDAAALDGLDDMLAQTGESGALIDRVLAAARARIGI